MRRDAEVVLLADPFEHGLGTVKGFDAHGWVWVEFVSGWFDKYDPMKLELADRWIATQLA